MQYPDDIVLLESLKNGDQSAYDLIFKKYYKLLWANAYLMLHDQQAAKDVVQTFFIDIWRKQLYLTMEGDIKAYLFRAVHNRCLNLIKKNGSEQVHIQAYGVNAGLQIAHPDTDRMDFEEQLHTILQEFPGQRRQAFKLVYLEHKKYQEAAQQMNVSVNSVKTHLKIAVRELRERLKYFR